jgi:hypothetical protein
MLNLLDSDQILKSFLNVILENNWSQMIRFMQSCDIIKGC